MISLYLALKNPWAKDDFRDLGSRSGDFPEKWSILKNKAWEIQAYWSTADFMSLAVDLSWQGKDHAGPSIEVNICGLNLSAEIYDVRHWDHDKGRWEEIAESPMEYQEPKK